MQKSLSGFTLAEVLITLGIIGVVAAMTMPVLIAKYKEKEIITKAKKDYSLIMQVLQRAQAEYETPNDNSSLFTSVETSAELTEAFAKFLPSAYVCLDSKKKMCSDLKYDVKMTYYPNKYTQSFAPPSIILPDNGVIHISLSSYKCVDTVATGANLDSEGNKKYNEDGSASMWTQTRNSCGDIYWDVNGPKEPNKFGYDAFSLGIWTNKVGKPYWNVYGTDSLYSILQGGNLIY